MKPIRIEKKKKSLLLKDKEKNTIVTNRISRSTFSISGRKNFFACKGNITDSSITINGDRNVITFLGDECEFKNVKIEINGSGNTFIIGSKARINNLYATFSSWEGYVAIDENCEMSSGIFSCNFQSKIKIGKNVFVNGSQLLSCGAIPTVISIGDNCMLAGGSRIETTDYHNIYDRETNILLNSPKNVTIEDNVWIGLEAFIFKGAYIPSGCVVGARAVLNKSFTEKNCVIVGTGRITRRNIRWKR